MKLPSLNVLVNRTRLHSLALLAALVCLTPTVQGAQGFNIDFGLAFGTPGPTYSGVGGQTGPWNKVGAVGTSLLFPAAGGTFRGTNVTVVAQVGTGSTGATPTDPLGLLMNDHFYSRSGGTWSVTFNGLADGDYNVVLYAPADLTVPTGNMMVGPFPVQGIPGGLNLQVQGITWTRMPVTVSGGTLPISGSSPGFSGLAGLQLIPIVTSSVSYCTAGTTASGCQATLWSYGTPSWSAGFGFVVTATGVEGNKDGVFFQGTNGAQSNPWGNGSSFQCVIPPVQRLGLLPGNGTNGSCDGTKVQDLNNLWASQPSKNPGPGTVTSVQLWFRDPFNTSNQTTSLSDAIVFVPTL